MARQINEQISKEIFNKAKNEIVNKLLEWRSKAIKDEKSPKSFLKWLRQQKNTDG